MASLTALMTAEHQKLELAASSLARMAEELAVEGKKFLDALSAHAALEEEIINPKVQEFYGGEGPNILARLAEMDTKLERVTPLLLTFSSSADSLKVFAAELQLHDSYETLEVLPGLDAGMANTERSQLMVALNERLAMPIPVGARRDLTGGLSANHGGLSKPQVMFSGPSYPFCK